MKNAGGTIAGGVADLELDSGGTIEGGSIDAAGNGLSANGGTLDGTASPISVGGKVGVARLDVTGTISSIDTLFVGSSGTLTLSGPHIAVGSAASTFTNDGGTVVLAGGSATLNGAFSNVGTIRGSGLLMITSVLQGFSGSVLEASGGALVFAGLLGAGSIAVDAAATLELTPGWDGESGKVPAAIGAGAC